MKKTETKKYKLDLSAYTIPGPCDKKGKEFEYPLRSNLSDFLRTAGMFRSAGEVVYAVALARKIIKTPGAAIILDGKEARMIKLVVDNLLMRAADGRSNFGGMRHEEVICRVANMEEINGE